MTSSGGAALSDVVIDSADDVFGTTQTDSAGSSGSVYEVVNGSETVSYLETFAVGTTGAAPQGTVLYNPATTDIFGLATEGGGNGYDGTVWDFTMHGNPFPPGGGGGAGGGGGVGTGLTPTIVSSTLPSAVVGGAKLHSMLKLSLIDAEATNGFTVNIYASTNPTLNASADTPVTSVANLTIIRAGKAVPLNVPILGLPTSLPDGSYFLIVQTLDSANNSASAATIAPVVVAAPFVSLSETVTTTLPPALVSGSKAKGTVTLVITNNGNVASKGPTAIDITASTISGVLGTSIATSSRNLSIPPGKSSKVTVPIKNTPALAAGDYFLVAQVTDPFAGGISLASSSGTTTIAAPFIALAGTLGPVTKLKSGDTLTITNNGNSDDVTTLTGTIGFSTDPLGAVPAGESASATSHTYTLKAGKSVKIHSTGWTQITAGTVSVTDEHGNSFLAVSSTSFTF
jgi:hypothetical protein